MTSVPFSQGGKPGDGDFCNTSKSTSQAGKAYARGSAIKSSVLGAGTKPYGSNKSDNAWSDFSSDAHGDAYSGVKGPGGTF